MDEIKNWIITKYLKQVNVEKVEDLTKEQKRGLEYQLDVITSDSDCVNTITKVIEENNEDVTLQDMYLLAITE